MSPPDGGNNDPDSQEATQFDPGKGDGDDPTEELYEARQILDERGPKGGGRGKGEYLIDWDGVDPDTGKRWEPSWQPKSNATDDLIGEWKEKKKVDSEIVGRWVREAKERKKEERRARTNATASKRRAAREREGTASEAGGDAGRKRKRSVSEMTETQSPARILANRNRGRPRKNVLELVPQSGGEASPSAEAQEPKVKPRTVDDETYHPQTPNKRQKQSVRPVPTPTSTTTTPNPRRPQQLALSRQAQEEDEVVEGTDTEEDEIEPIRAAGPSRSRARPQASRSIRSQSASIRGTSPPEEGGPTPFSSRVGTTPAGKPQTVYGGASVRGPTTTLRSRQASERSDSPPAAVTMRRELVVEVRNREELTQASQYEVDEQEGEGDVGSSGRERESQVNEGEGERSGDEDGEVDGGGDGGAFMDMQVDDDDFIPVRNIRTTINDTPSSPPATTPNPPPQSQSQSQSQTEPSPSPAPPLPETLTARRVAPVEVLDDPMDSDVPGTVSTNHQSDSQGTKPSEGESQQERQQSQQQEQDRLSGMQEEQVLEKPSQEDEIEEEHEEDDVHIRRNVIEQEEEEDQLASSTNQASQPELEDEDVQMQDINGDYAANGDELEQTQSSAAEEGEEGTQAILAGAHVSSSQKVGFHFVADVFQGGIDEEEEVEEGGSQVEREGSGGEGQRQENGHGEEEGDLPKSQDEQVSSPIAAADRPASPQPAQNQASQSGNGILSAIVTPIKQRAFGPLAHLTPSIFEVLRRNDNADVPTQETIDEFSSPVREPSPGLSRRRNAFRQPNPATDRPVREDSPVIDRATRQLSPVAEQPVPHAQSRSEVEQEEDSLDAELGGGQAASVNGSQERDQDGDVNMNVGEAISVTVAVTDAVPAVVNVIRHLDAADPAVAGSSSNANGNLAAQAVASPVAESLVFACGWRDCEERLGGIDQLRTHLEAHANAPVEAAAGESSAQVQELQQTIETLRNDLAQRDQTISANKLESQKRSRKISELEEEVEKEQANGETVMEEMGYIRGLYDSASSKAFDLAQSVQTLTADNGKLKQQLDLGLKQQKLHHQAVAQGKDREITTLRGQLDFLIAQNRATGDAVRKRAAQYPKLQKQILELKGEIQDERVRGGLRERELKRANRDLKWHRDERRMLREQNNRFRETLDVQLLESSSDDGSSQADDEDEEPNPEEEYVDYAELVARGIAPAEPSDAESRSEADQPKSVEEPPGSASIDGDMQVEVEQRQADDVMQIDPPIEVRGDDFVPVPSAAGTGVRESDFQVEPVHDRGIVPRESLLSYLNKSFATGSTPFQLRIDIAESRNKRSSTLFPYTAEHHKIWEKRMLVTVTAITEANEGPAENGSSLILCALEAYIYTVSDTLSSLIYISKVDSTGYSPLAAEYKPPPTTTTLMTSFIKYYLSPATRPTPRVFFRLFARAQNQYLFPNSIESGSKKTLSGLGLSKWWKAVFDKAINGLGEEHGAVEADSTGQSSDEDRYQLRCWLPGLEASEARSMLGVQKLSLPDGATWAFDALSIREEPSVLFGNPQSGGSNSVGGLVPHLEDDPKARYLDELVAERLASQQNSGSGKSRSGNAAGNASQSLLKGLLERRKANAAKAKEDEVAALSGVTLEYYWETLAARQECQPGDITGFFSIGVHPKSSSAIDSRDTAALEHRLQSGKGIDVKVVERLLNTLLNHDFANLALARDSSARYLAASQNILVGEIQAERWQAECVTHVAKNADPVRKPDPKVATSAAKVNVLSVVKRKKKPNPPQTPSQTQSPIPTQSPAHTTSSDLTDDQDLPSSVYMCKWRAPDNKLCGALHPNLDEFEKHGVTHLLRF